MALSRHATQLTNDVARLARELQVPVNSIEPTASCVESV